MVSFLSLFYLSIDNNSITYLYMQIIKLWYVQLRMVLKMAKRAMPVPTTITFRRRRRKETNATCDRSFGISNFMLCTINLCRLVSPSPNRAIVDNNNFFAALGTTEKHEIATRKTLRPQTLDRSINIDFLLANQLRKKK